MSNPESGDIDHLTGSIDSLEVVDETEDGDFHFQTYLGVWMK